MFLAGIHNVPITTFWQRDTYCFMIFFPITVTEAVYSVEKAQKMKNLSVTVIALNFLIFFDKCHGRDT